MGENTTAIYLRLSRDDGNLSESESIINQKEFLIDYANRNSLNVVKILSDDGYSGTSFDRPAFKELLCLIENDDVNTVITKDLSRLGRDYIQTGYYLEQYFPLHNVRYIAVNDNIDTMSQSSGNDMTPFRAVFNDMYAKDISKKVRTALTTKKSNGKFIGSAAPYGYKKDPNDKGHLVIDEDAAVYVRRIYKEFLSGESIIAIAHKLTLDKIPTPSEYKGLTAAHKKYKGVWNDGTVKRILSNPTYAGNLTQNTGRKVSYKINKKIRLPKDEWIIVENTHRPIVSYEDFDAAAQMLSKRSYCKVRRTGEPHLLSGLVFCKDCGAAMSFTKESQTRTYLVCSRWRKNARLGICTSHSMRELYVENAVKESLKKLASAIDTSEILTGADAFFNSCNNDDRLIEELRRKLELCKNTAVCLYKDKASGTITESEYEEINNALREERVVYETRIDELCQTLEKRENTNNVAEILNSIICFDEIDRNTLLMLVDKIYIGKNKEIEIVFKFDNPNREGM